MWLCLFVCLFAIMCRTMGCSTRSSSLLSMLSPKRSANRDHSAVRLMPPPTVAAANPSQPYMSIVRLRSAPTSRTNFSTADIFGEARIIAMHAHVHLHTNLRHMLPKKQNTNQNPAKQVQFRIALRWFDYLWTRTARFVRLIGGRGVRRKVHKIYSGYRKRRQSDKS